MPKRIAPSAMQVQELTALLQGHTEETPRSQVWAQHQRRVATRREACDTRAVSGALLAERRRLHAIRPPDRGAAIHL